MSNVSLVESINDARQNPDPDGYLWASTKTVILGDFYEDPTFLGLGIRAGVGCLPVVGQLMDFADTAAWVVLAYERGLGDDEVMLNGAILFIGFVPGVGDVLRNVLKGLVSNRAMKGMAKLLEKLANTVSKNQYKALKEAVLDNWDDIVGKAIGTADSFLKKYDELLKELKAIMPSRLAAPIDDFISFIGQLRASVDSGFRKALAKPREKLEKMFAETDKAAGAVSVGALGTAKRVDNISPIAKSNGMQVGPSGAPSTHGGPMAADRGAKSPAVAQKQLNTTIPIKDPDYRTPTMEGGPNHPKGADSPATPKTEGDPIDVISGAMLVQETDFELPGPIPFKFSRSWSSTGATRVGGLGRGWIHSVDKSLQVEPNRTAVQLDGRTLYFAPLDEVGDSSYNRGAKCSLVRRSKGYVLFQEDGLRLAFGDVGRGKNIFMLSGIADRNDNRIWLSYREGLLVEIVDSAGRRIEFKNNEFGFLTDVYVPHPQNTGSESRTIRIVSYEYDDEPHLVGVIDALRNKSRYRYDASHLIVQSTDRNGGSFYWEYDESGLWPRCSKTWGDNNILHREFSYDKPNRITTVTDFEGNATIYHGHQVGMPAKKIDALGGETLYDYDIDGNLLSETDPVGSVTCHEYDENGRAIATLTPDGKRSETSYDHKGLPTGSSSEGEKRQTSQYDECGNLLAESDDKSEGRAHVYDRRGLRTKTTNHHGDVLCWKFDDAGNLAAETDSKGNTQNYRYDALGRLVADVDPVLGETRYAWDLMGRVVQKALPGGAIWRYQYDAEGNPVAEESPSGEVERRYYGPGPVLIAKQSRGGMVTAYEYDRELQLTSLTDEEGRVWKIERDPLGLASAEIAFDGRRMDYTYDLAGRLRSKTTALGRSTTFEYDALGQVVGKLYSDGSAARFEYDSAGRLVLAANDVTTTTFAYDSDGNIIEERNNDFATTSRYDGTGNRLTRVSPWNRRLEFSYTSRAQLESVSGEHGSLEFEYDTNGREVRRTLPSGVHFDRNYRPSGEWVCAVMGADERELATRTYSFKAGHIEKIDDPQLGGSLYVFDAKHRLHGASYSDQHIEHFPQDQSGQMAGTPTQLGGEGDSDCTEVHGWSVEWDASGNIVRKQKAHRAFEYSYDGAGQLATVKTLRLDAGHATVESLVSFEYDALGRRVRKTSQSSESTGSTMFYWEGNVLIGEEREGEPPIEYLYRHTSYEPMMSFGSAGVRYLECDQRCAPHTLVDELGQVVWSASYRAYGQIVGHEGDTGEVPFRFAGQYADQETGLHYNRFRYYDPELCIYGTADPLGFDGGVAVYAYPSDPLLLVDPLGLQCKQLDSGFNNNQAPPKKPSNAGESTHKNSVTGETIATPGGQVHTAPFSPVASKESIDELYEKAALAKGEIDIKAHAIAAKHGGRVAEAPLKGRDTAVKKINKKYEGDATRIKDVARNTIIVPADKIEAVTADLVAGGANPKVINGATDPMGYSGVNSTMKTESGIVAEIQVNSPEMIYAKEPESLARTLLGDETYDAVSAKAGVPGGKGHTLYEEYRELPDADPGRAALEAESKQYYATVRGG